MKAKSPTSDASTARAGVLHSRPRGRGRPDCQDPQLVKFCSKAFVPKLVERALPGMAPHTSPRPPLPFRRVDAQYFSISRSGPCWDHIVQSRQVGVYIPGELTGIGT